MFWILYIAGMARVEFEGEAAAAACHRAAELAGAVGAAAHCVLTVGV